MKIHSFKYEKIYKKHTSQILTFSHEYVNSTTRSIFLNIFLRRIFQGVQEVTDSPKIVYPAAFYETDAGHRPADGV